MGAADPRYNQYGAIDQRPASQLKGMRHADPAPVRLQPIPLSIMNQAQAISDASKRQPEATVVMDMTWIAFYYMLRSGEHCYTNENKPLRARQISFSIGTRKLEPFKCTYDELRKATSSSITFETQKNRQKGKIIAHGISGHVVACPTKALARRIIHVRSIGGSPNTPLCSIARHANGWVVVTSSLLTNLLRSATVLEPDSGVIPEKVQTRSLRAGGAMALLCAQVDSDMIKLVGRWRSDAMFWYLHAQATPVIKNLASKMHVHGAFQLEPGTDVPPREQHVLQLAAHWSPSSSTTS